MTRFRNGVLGVALLCLIIGLMLKLDRSILSTLGMPESWLHWVQIIDHVVFPIGALLFLSFIFMQSRVLKREKQNADAMANSIVGDSGIDAGADRKR